MRRNQPPGWLQLVPTGPHSDPYFVWSSLVPLSLFPASILTFLFVGTTLSVIVVSALAVWVAALVLLRLFYVYRFRAYTINPSSMPSNVRVLGPRAHAAQLIKIAERESDELGYRFGGVSKEVVTLWVFAGMLISLSRTTFMTAEQYAIGLMGCALAFAFAGAVSFRCYTVNERWLEFDGSGLFGRFDGPRCRVSLRNVRIESDFSSWTLKIVSQEGSEEWRFPLAGMWRPHAFCAAVIAAAQDGESSGEVD